MSHDLQPPIGCGGRRHSAPIGCGGQRRLAQMGNLIYCSKRSCWCWRNNGTGGLLDCGSKNKKKDEQLGYRNPPRIIFQFEDKKNHSQLYASSNQGITSPAGVPSRGPTIMTLSARNPAAGVLKHDQSTPSPARTRRPWPRQTPHPAFSSLCRSPSARQVTAVGPFEQAFAGRSEDDPVDDGPVGDGRALHLQTTGLCEQQPPLRSDVLHRC